MIIPDIGGVLHLWIPATGLRKDIVCESMKDAYAKLKQFKEQEPSAKLHQVDAIYHPHAFSIE
jgi:hypothetical protein